MSQKNLLVLIILIITAFSSNMFADTSNSPREVVLQITGDFPEGELLNPEVATLNSKDVRDHTFLPDKYILEIQQPGYAPVHEEIVIMPGSEPYYIYRMLTTIPRKVSINIDYNVAPSPHLGPYKVTIAHIDYPHESREIKTGDSIKPGAYLLKIEKPAYETIEVKQNVWPDERQFSIDQMLRAKQVTIHINVTHDIKPPQNLLPYQVSLIGKKGTSLLKDGKKIFPGSYVLKISQPGYSYDTNKTIDIAPSEEPFLINEHITANKRQISFEMVDPDTGLLVESLNVTNLLTGQKATLRDTYFPGEKVAFRIEFAEYETQEVFDIVVPGEGPFVLPVPMVKKNNN